MNYATTLGTRARYDNEAKRFEQALLYNLEAEEIYRNRVLTAQDNPSSYDLNQYINQIRWASNCAKSVGNTAEILRLTQLEQAARKRWSIQYGADEQATALMSNAKLHRDAGRLADAAEAYESAIQLLRPAFEEATWHWYRRYSLGNAYRSLAETHREMKDYAKEVLANREYLKLVVGPLHGANINEVVVPSRPTDEAEAIKVRAFIKTSLKGMKRFFIPCDFNGIPHVFPIYITEMPPTGHPLDDQQSWMLTVRGGRIPQDWMDKFERLHKIALENKVSFVDLCFYALNSTVAEGERVRVEDVVDNPAAPDFVEAPTLTARDPLANLKARLVDLKTKLDNAPNDLNLASEAAKLYEELSKQHLVRKEFREALDVLRESVRLHEELVRARPTVADLRLTLASSYLSLGKIQVQFKDYDAAYACYHRRLDLLEQLQPGVPPSDKISAIAETHLLFGELSEQRGNRSDALRWYTRAFQEKGSDATRKIANLLLLSPELAALLPGELQQIYAQMKKDGKPVAGGTFVSDYAKEVERSLAATLRRQQVQQMADLDLLAEQYDDLADAYKAKGRENDRRQALSKEFDVLSEQAKLDTVRRPLSGRRAAIAAELGRSYLGEKKTGLAIEWITRAGDLGHTDSQLQLSDWYEKGTMVKADLKKADQYGYLGHYSRGVTFLQNGRFEDALVDLKKVCNSQGADADDHDKLGQCYGNLKRWDEAIIAYTRSIELDLKGAQATRVVLRLVEAMVIAEHPAQVFELLQSIEKKGWKLPTDGSVADECSPLFHGLRAIALRMSGKDASDAERLMLQFVEKPGFRTADWTSDYLDKWLTTTKLAPGLKVPVQRIVHELKRTPESLLYLADWYEKGIDGKADAKKANHYRYLAHYERGTQSYGEKRYADALPDLNKVCESGEATQSDHNRLAMCHGKLGQWDEAIKSYVRAIELDTKSESATGFVLNLLEAFTCAERPEQLLRFVDDVEQKGWKLPTDGPDAGKYNAIFHGFRAIALKLTGKDSSQAEQAMRRFTAKPDFKITDWTWDELNGWLKKTKLAPDRKAAAEKIIAELQGTKIP